MADETIKSGAIPQASGATTATTSPSLASTTSTGGAGVSGQNGSGDAGSATSSSASPHVEEAKSRFNAALEDAKAGAYALKDEAVTRASSYREQARGKGEDWTADARGRAGDLAVEGKAKASGALLGLSKLVDENAARIDENLGPRYGDYARNASRSIKDTADALDRKSVEELGEDARAFVREQPAMAVGLAAAAGFFFARLFRK